MHEHLLIDTGLQPSQLDVSRAAERRYALASAVRAGRAARTPRPVRRLRHAIAGGLITTARLIDAT